MAAGSVRPPAATTAGRPQRISGLPRPRYASLRATFTHVCRKDTLIVPAPTGVTYANQVGGCNCIPAELEGFCVPLCGELPQTWVFDPEWWYSNLTWRPNQLSAEDQVKWESAFKEVERVASHWKAIFDLEVLRSEANLEAWFHVEFDASPDFDEHPNELHRIRGVLTWEKCD